MSSKTNILSTNNLSIGYKHGSNELIVGSSININLLKGQLAGLIGINGSGKSTLLRTLSGSQELLTGSITINNDLLSSIPPTELSKRLSIVLTNQPISKNLSVYELVALGRQPYTNWIGTLSKKDFKWITEAMIATDTERLSAKKCYELSDGQFQRVLIARAIAQETDIILLDEPLMHLDLHHKAAVLNLLSEIAHHRGKTVLFSTHDIEYALNRCDTMITMKNGNIVQKTPEKLIEDGDLETLFPSKNVYFDSENRTFLLK